FYKMHTEAVGKDVETALTYHPSKESQEKYELAFAAMLAYEMNCIAKYDYPDRMCRPSRCPVKGERMSDYAIRYGTTLFEMKEHSLQMAVDRALNV
ncbi:MAG: hypothetical protein KAS32_11845, partial [Candidatus Peribacteraceae bacterium]|nr:hypothetical protein [Candidatus Peribacteraceae bacterium]